MTPADAARGLEKVATALPAALAAAERLSLLELRDIVRDPYSSGPLQEAGRRRMDRPYARRHGSPRLNPDIVNKQDPGGAFYEAWEASGPESAGDALASSLWNESDEAGYLAQEEGNSKTTMFARHPEDAAADDEEPRRVRRVEDVLGRFF